LGSVGTDPLPPSLTYFTRSGYYLATLEAATQHILDLGQQYEQEVLFHGGGTGTGPGGAEETVRADFDDFAS